MSDQRHRQLRSPPNEWSPSSQIGIRVVYISNLTSYRRAYLGINVYLWRAMLSPRLLWHNIIESIYILFMTSQMVLNLFFVFLLFFLFSVKCQGESPLLTRLWSYAMLLRAYVLKLFFDDWTIMKNNIPNYWRSSWFEGSFSQKRITSKSLC